MKKLKKIANKPIKSMKNAGTVRIRTFLNHQKVKFSYRLIQNLSQKTSENHLKSSCFTIKILGQYELILFVLSKIHEKSRISSNKTEKLIKITHNHLKINGKYWDSTTHTSFPPSKTTYKIKLFVLFSKEFKLKSYEFKKIFHSIEANLTISY